jgi:carbamoyl-phosphate synthase small subunit
MSQRAGRLVLEDGTTFSGCSFGKECGRAGEVVFTTGMVGYPESLTDPSYRGQILVLTYPLIGNYGVPPHTERNGLLDFFESDRIQISGLVVADYSERYNHWNAEQSLSKWLTDGGVPALTGVDTRALTKRLREKGVMLGKIVFEEDMPFLDPNVTNLVAEVSIPELVEYRPEGTPRGRIALLDCGAKSSIVKSFLARGIEVVRAPWNYPLADLKFDGLLISNGPGDPKMCSDAIRNIQKIMQKSLPVMGICLGNQLLALAAGADTYKLKYGHRGQNQPCVDMGSGRCYITSQNHGYAVDERTLPRNWEPLFRNANDETNEGIRHRSKPFFSAQFHPEANPGPVDTAFLFDDFIKICVQSR